MSTIHQHVVIRQYVLLTESSLSDIWKKMKMCSEIKVSNWCMCLLFHNSKKQIRYCPVTCTPVSLAEFQSWLLFFFLLLCDSWLVMNKNQGAAMKHISAILLWGLLLSTSQGCGLRTFSVEAILVTFKHELEGKPHNLAPLALLKMQGRKK